MRSLFLASALGRRRRHSLRTSGRAVRRSYAEVRVMRGEHHALSRRVEHAVAAL